MGTDITSYVERRTADGEWERARGLLLPVEDPVFDDPDEPFGLRSYRLFAFLAGVRNFQRLDILRTLGDPQDVRIVFWFDN